MENSFYAPTGEIWGIAEKSINEKQRTKQPENKRGDPSFAITTVGGQIGINDMRDKPIGMKHRPIAIKDDPLQFSAIAKCTKEGEYLAHFDVHHFMKMLGIGVRKPFPPGPIVLQMLMEHTFEQPGLLGRQARQQMNAVRPFRNPGDELLIPGNGIRAVPDLAVDLEAQHDPDKINPRL